MRSARSSTGCTRRSSPTSGGPALGDLVAQVDQNLFMVGLAPRVPKVTQHKISQMLDLSMPMAVFVGPPGTD